VDAGDAGVHEAIARECDPVCDGDPIWPRSPSRSANRVPSLRSQITGRPASISSSS